MGALIDSSVLVAAERGKLPFESLLEERRDILFALSVITASELLHGVHRAKTAAQKARREAFVEAILASLPIVPFDFLAARAHARLWTSLAAKGANVGAHDLIIGATAVSRGFLVVTRDARSFGRIPGLEVERW